MNVIPTWDCRSFELDLHLLAELPIERTERLVEEQEARPVHQRPRERHPLLLPAGHLARLAVREPAHLHHLERLADPAPDLGLVRPLLSKAVRDVLRDGHVGEEGVVLEHGVHVALVRRHALDRGTGDPDLAFVGILEPRQHPERRRLPAPGRSEQREELTGAHPDVEGVDRGHRAEALRDADEFHRAVVGARPAGPHLRGHEGECGEDVLAAQASRLPGLQARAQRK